MEIVFGIDHSDNRRLVRAERAIKQQSGRAGECSCRDYVKSVSLPLLSLTLLSLKLPLSLILYPPLAFQRERRWQSSTKSSLIFPCSRLCKWNGGARAGRRSHSCSESLSKLPTPPKNSLLYAQYLQSLCYHSNSLGIHHLHQALLPPLHKGSS